MILIALGRWNHSAGRWLIRERIWWRSYHWTPFVWVRWRFQLAMQLAYMLPRRVVGFAIIRAWAHATTGPWSHEEATGITTSDMLERWEKADDGI